MKKLVVLTEDRSSVPILRRLVGQVLAAWDVPYGFEIFFHRGRGNLPKDLASKPGIHSSSMLQLLPAKLRAYAAATRPDQVLLVVVLDSDDSPVNQLYASLAQCCNLFAPDHVYCIGIAVEEFESWLLGDIQALRRAYPDLDYDQYLNYRQDSICGTWEVLARVIQGPEASQLIEQSYPAVGAYKLTWARRIAAHMQLDTNCSPSFKRFVQHLTRALKLWEDKQIG